MNVACQHPTWFQLIFGCDNPFVEPIASLFVLFQYDAWHKVFVSFVDFVKRACLIIIGVEKVTS